MEKSNAQRDETLWDMNARRRALFGCTTEELCGVLKSYGLEGYEPDMVRARLVESIIRHENALRIEAPIGLVDDVGCSAEKIEADAEGQRAEEAESGYKQIVDLSDLVRRVEILEEKVRTMAPLSSFVKTDV